VQLKDNLDDTKDQLSWKWAKGAQSSVVEMMNPQFGSATYRVCVYDGTANPQPRMELDIPHGGTCGTKPCWKANGPEGVGYTNKAGTPNGITALKFKGGSAGKAAIQVKGKGTNLPMMPLGDPGAPPVTVQLVVIDGPTSACWQSTFPALRVNLATQLSAKSP